MRLDLALRASPPVLLTHPLTYPLPPTHLQVHPSLVAVAVGVVLILRVRLRLLLHP